MNDEIKELLNEIKEEVEKSVDENYGLPYTYRVVCDETNNTPEDAENDTQNS